MIWFKDMLANAILKLGFPEALVERAVDQVGELSFDTQCSRSVQGTLRTMIADLESTPVMAATSWNWHRIQYLRSCVSDHAVSRA